MSSTGEQAATNQWRQDSSSSTTESTTVEAHPDAMVPVHVARPPLTWSSEQEVPWLPLAATSLYTASTPLVVPADVPRKSQANAFGITALLVSLFVYLVPLASVANFEQLAILADEGAGLRVGLSYFFVLAVGVGLAVPLALVAVILAFVSFRSETRGKLWGTVALVFAGVPLLAALAVSIAFLLGVPLPV